MDSDRSQDAGSGDAREDDGWTDLVAGLRIGDPGTLRWFMDRYGPALERIAQRAIDPQLRRRFGAESVVQSACRTFFRRARGGEFELSDPGRTWSLLVAIALTKVRDRRRFHLRRKRGVHHEVRTSAPHSEVPDAADPGPAPDELAALDEAFSRVMDDLDEEERRMVELRLAGRTQADVARDLGCSERTVRRRLDELEARLREALGV